MVHEREVCKQKVNIELLLSLGAAGSADSVLVYCGVTAVDGKRVEEHQKVFMCYGPSLDRQNSGVDYITNDLHRCIKFLRDSGQEPDEYMLLGSLAHMVYRKKGGRVAPFAPDSARGRVETERVERGLPAAQPDCISHFMAQSGKQEGFQVAERFQKMGMTLFLMLVTDKVDGCATKEELDEVRVKAEQALRRFTRFEEFVGVAFAAVKKEVDDQKDINVQFLAAIKEIRQMVTRWGAVGAGSSAAGVATAATPGSARAAAVHSPLGIRNRNALGAAPCTKSVSSVEATAEAGERHENDAADEVDEVDEVDAAGAAADAGEAAYGEAAEADEVGAGLLSAHANELSAAHAETVVAKEAAAYAEARRARATSAAEHLVKEMRRVHAEQLRAHAEQQRAQAAEAVLVKAHLAGVVFQTEVLGERVADDAEAIAAAGVAAAAAAERTAALEAEVASALDAAAATAVRAAALEAEVASAHDAAAATAVRTAVRTTALEAEVAAYKRTLDEVRLAAYAFLHVALYVACPAALSASPFGLSFLVQFFNLLRLGLGLVAAHARARQPRRGGACMAGLGGVERVGAEGCHEPSEASGAAPKG